ncbi:hypothetical protein ACSBR2_026995 [Camellia fascicularis]
MFAFFANPVDLVFLFIVTWLGLVWQLKKKLKSYKKKLKSYRYLLKKIYKKINIHNIKYQSTSRQSMYRPKSIGVKGKK